MVIAYLQTICFYLNGTLFFHYMKLLDCLVIRQCNLLFHKYHQTVKHHLSIVSLTCFHVFLGYDSKVVNKYVVTKNLGGSVRLPLEKQTLRHLYEKSATPSTAECTHLTKNYLYLILQACPTNTFSRSNQNLEHLYAYMQDVKNNNNNNNNKFSSFFFGKGDVEETRPFYKINGSQLQIINFLKIIEK